ncbi:hypothetical protein [Streptosporangium amethystogenes]|uniref:hypothetical protein n=1 Tax=Streptosporangium amethystogenes TaxID=2002 RepID=UPI0004CC03F9|nr:hypothetical protein [Streptosporangium amethystogenes]
MRVRIVTICATVLVMGVAGTASGGTGQAQNGAKQARTGTGPAKSWTGHAQAGTQRTQGRFSVANLVSDVSGRAAVTDPTLINPWGLAMGSGLATVYSGGAGTPPPQGAGAARLPESLLPVTAPPLGFPYP